MARPPRSRDRFQSAARLAEQAAAPPPPSDAARRRAQLAAQAIAEWDIGAAALEAPDRPPIADRVAAEMLYGVRLEMRREADRARALRAGQPPMTDAEWVVARRAMVVSLRRWLERAGSV